MIYNIKSRVTVAEILQVFSPTENSTPSDFSVHTTSTTEEEELSESVNSAENLQAVGSPWNWFDTHYLL